MKNKKRVSGEMDKERTMPLRARLRRAFCGMTATYCRIEIQGRRELMVHGCRGIEAYHPTEILLRVRDGEITLLRVAGEGLLCSTYHSEGVVIEGTIHRVDLLQGEEGKEA